MTTSLAQTDYLPISNSGGFSGGFIAQDIVSLDPAMITTMNTSTVSGNVTISNTAGSSFYYTGAGIGGTISIGTIGSGATVTLSGSGSGYEWQMPVEWQDHFPDWNKVQKMCEEYPGLKIAFEKFKTTYKLVIDHYDTPEDKRPLP